MDNNFGAEEYIPTCYIKRYEVNISVRRLRQFTSVILDRPTWVVALVSAD